MILMCINLKLKNKFEKKYLLPFKVKNTFKTYIVPQYQTDTGTLEFNLIIIFTSLLKKKK